MKYPDRSDGPGLHELFALFPSVRELPEVEIVPGHEVPPPYHGLLVHNHHMTVTVEAYHGGPVYTRILERTHADEWYARMILLCLESNDEAVQFGIVRVYYPYLSPQVRDEILAGRTPLGRILIQHNVLRRIEPTAYLRVIPGPSMTTWFALDQPRPTYGRLALIYCDEQPAVELLEIVAPSRPREPSGACDVTSPARLAGPTGLDSNGGFIMRRPLLLPCLLLPLLAGCMEGSKEDKHARASAPESLAMPRPSLYDRLGEEPAITKVVDDFIVIVIADPKIKEEHKEHFRDEKRVGELKKKLVDQIGEATGGPQKYMGKNMKDAHKNMKISDADFDALAGDLLQALQKNNVGPQEQQELLNLLGPMRKDVVEQPEAKENS